MPGVIRVDLSNFPKRLFDHAVKLFTAFGLYTFNERSNTLQLVSDFKSHRSQLGKVNQTIPSWISFHVAVECLLKAVLLKHEVPIIRKRGLKSTRCIK